MRVIVIERTRKGISLATQSRQPKRRWKPEDDVHDWIVVNEEVHIPTSVVDFDSFNDWCRSDSYPERASVFWIGGMIWIESFPDRPTQNFVRQEFARCLDNLARETGDGVVFAERVRLTVERESLSVEPELMYISTERVRNGRVRIRSNKKGRIYEIEGPPDMILESMSDSSEAKEKRLEELCYSGGVDEVWRIDSRESEVRFDILRRGPTGFVTTPRKNGRVKSAVFGRTFELLAKMGTVGIAEFTLAVGE